MALTLSMLGVAGFAAWAKLGVENVRTAATAGQLRAYLPTGFPNSNPFGQQWVLQALQPSSGKFQSLVFSRNGTPISDTKQLVQIAAQAGALGGFIPYPNQAGDTAMSPASAFGAYGGWSVPLARAWREYAVASRP